MTQLWYVIYHLTFLTIYQPIFEHLLKKKGLYIHHKNLTHYLMVCREYVSHSKNFQLSHNYKSEQLE